MEALGSSGRCGFVCSVGEGDEEDGEEDLNETEATDSATFACLMLYFSMNKRSFMHKSKETDRDKPFDEQGPRPSSPCQSPTSLASHRTRALET